jgi:hypothetical protein
MSDHNSELPVDGSQHPAVPAGQLGGAVEPGGSKQLGHEGDGEHDGEHNDPLAELELNESALGELHSIYGMLNMHNNCPLHCGKLLLFTRMI